MVELKTSFQEFRQKERPPTLPPSTDKEVEIKKDKAWLEYVQATLGVLQRKPMNPSIHKVPDKLRQVNPDAYTPRVVSIGPYHNGERNLQAMEEQKWHYVLHLFHRSAQLQNHHHGFNSIPELAKHRAQACPEAVLSLDSEVRGSYSQNIDLSKHDLAEIMLVDGCFILELLLRFSDWAGNSNPDLHSNVDLRSDPIFCNAWMIPTLRHDLALLENQMPFSILEKLLHTLKPGILTSSPQCLKRLAISFFFESLPLKPLPHVGVEIRHLLDLLHIFYLPTSAESCEKTIWEFKYSATRLVERGIQIHKQNCSTQLRDEEYGAPAVTGSTRDGFMDITFGKSEGDLKIPTLRIDQNTESIFRNLIAFEQCSLNSTHHVTSYALLLRSFIQTQRDAQYLLQNEIIVYDSNGGGAEDPEELFRGLCKEVVRKHSYFAAVCDDANEFDREWWHWKRSKARASVWWQRQVGDLKTNYFGNPWTAIAVVFAIIISLLGLAQTILYLLSYIRG